MAALPTMGGATKYPGGRTTDHKTTKYVVDLSGVPCPACGSSDRWDSMVPVESDDHNPELRVGCDCGMGEVVVIIE